MSKHNTIGFSYRVEGVTLQNTGEQLRTTTPFITHDIIEAIDQQLKPQNYKVDPSSLRIKYTDDQLYIEGFAVEKQEPKTVGFLSGR
ncbi:hypothetical protein LLH06_20585 [Mucilaginibacter daejeonensis]|uniref:hypothetical protein n=1 Tax=Mucilaginibacter daejeonensis TaxID=398049 RepID=UPI001D178E41|nr:hypothetical protein [Mucilaginibacter daejeonensis]UEG53338.1 hypothetical protein LLH06_20585 [Mucilaginibacter daejeonensis]